MHAGLVGRDLAGVDELLHIGVVARDADERVVVHEVGARVAHVRDGKLSALDVGCRGGAAHAGTPHAVGSRLHDGGVCRLHGPCELSGVGCGGGVLGDGLHRDGGGHFAGRVPAHAVGDAEERRLHEVGVLVVGAHAAHVGAGTPHEGRGGAGVVGGVGVDALRGDGLKALGGARVGEAGLDLGHVDLGRGAGFGATGSCGGEGRVHGLALEVGGIGRGGVLGVVCHGGAGCVGGGMAGRRLGGGVVAHGVGRLVGGRRRCRSRRGGSWSGRSVVALAWCLAGERGGKERVLAVGRERGVGERGLAKAGRGMVRGGCCMRPDGRVGGAL